MTAPLPKYSALLAMNGARLASARPFGQCGTPVVKNGAPLTRNSAPLARNGAPDQ